MELDIKGNELDLLASCFIHDPYPKIERALAKLDFHPVSQIQLAAIQASFSQSRIIKPEHVTVTFLTEIMPTGHLKLLYQHSTELAIARKEFQRWEQL
jgi:hypothetical protein